MGRWLGTDVGAITNRPPSGLRVARGQGVVPETMSGGHLGRSDVPRKDQGPLYSILHPGMPSLTALRDPRKAPWAHLLTRSHTCMTRTRRHHVVAADRTPRTRRALPARRP